MEKDLSRAAVSKANGGQWKVELASPKLECGGEIGAEKWQTN